MPRFVFKLPDIGEGTAEAEIAAWRVKVGDRVEEDAPLVDMMTDKATVELTSPVGGTVLEIAGEAGAMVPVGAALVVLETSAAEDIGAMPEPQADGPAIVEAAVAAHVAKPALPHPGADAPVPLPLNAGEGEGATLSRERGKGTAPKAQGEGGARSEAAPPLAAPAVRARAKALGIDLASLAPGPHGRIRHSDLDRLLQSQPSPRQRGRGTGARSGPG